MSGSSVTSACAQKYAVRFGQKISIVDTPGVFDTKESNKNVQQEIVKCISISSPGPHAFILVLNIARYNKDEEKSMQHFVDALGEKVFKYVIILFTRKDYLDEEGKSLYDHIKTAPVFLRALAGKCGRRIIAFNNKLTGYEGDEQVKELLSIIHANVEQNDGECYKNDIYIEAEKRLQEKEAEIRRQAKLKRDRDLQKMREDVSDKLAKTAEQLKYENRHRMIRAIAREELENAEYKRFINTAWNISQLILPGVFSTLK